MKNHSEPPVLLHNSGVPPRTDVNTSLPPLCAHLPTLCGQGSCGQMPIFSVPHALVLAGHLDPGKGEFPILSDWMTNGGLVNQRLWTEGSQATPQSVSERWPTPAALLRHLRLKELHPLPAGLHFLIGTELTYERRWEVFGGWSPGRGMAPPKSPPPDFRVVPDPALTLAVVSRFCGGVLYGSRTPELDYPRLTGTALAFDDPLLRGICFPNPTSPTP